MIPTNMSNKDPLPNGHANGTQRYGSTVYSSATLNPTAGQFQPSFPFSHASQPKNSTMQQSAIGQVSSTSPTYMMEKIQGLERSQHDLRTDVEDLKTLCNGLHLAIQSMKKGGWSVEVGPFQEVQSQKEKLEYFHQKLDQLKLETLNATSGADTGTQKKHGSVADADQRSQTVSPTLSSASVPPHLRNGLASIPPHLRGKQQAIKANISLPSQKAVQSSGSLPSQKTMQSNGFELPERRIAVAKG